MQTVMLPVRLWEIIIGQKDKALEASGQLLSLVGIAESFTIFWRDDSLVYQKNAADAQQAFCIEPKIAGRPDASSGLSKIFQR